MIFNRSSCYSNFFAANILYFSLIGSFRDNGPRIVVSFAKLSGCSMKKRDDRFAALNEIFATTKRVRGGFQPTFSCVPYAARGISTRRNADFNRSQSRDGDSSFIVGARRFVGTFCVSQ